MNRRILLQVTAPVVVIGLLLTGACLVSAWYVNRLQSGMTNILVQNVSSVQAAQQLEISVRQLRFHSFGYLIDPNPELLNLIRQDQKRFEEWLVRAEEAAYTAEERPLVQLIQEGYKRYQGELERQLQEADQGRVRRDVRALTTGHPLSQVVDPCREYLRLNEEIMTRSAQEDSQVSQRLNVLLLFLGLGGPLGGLLAGYGFARGLSRSLYRLNVQVQDLTHHLDRDVAAMNLIPLGDLDQLEPQVEHVVRRVAEVAECLQRHQRELLRAQQLAAVGQLAASVAHEVRNPLTSIKLLVEVGLRDRKPRPFTQENLQIIHGEVLRLEQTVQGFLDFARPPVLRPQKCDLGGVVGQVIELIRARARQQRVHLDVCCPDQPVSGYVDPGQLRGVFVNLFVNALDAMPAGGQLGARLELSGPGEVRLVVTDTGSGLTSEVAERLFTPFFSTKPTGSGLGLSISRRIIEDHGGSITAVNRAGGGACFTVTLPQRIQEEKYVGPAGH